ncbi:unnamed protein product [Closterium sp. NIES-64]|nr:unnamed protein product [Closterium sp. NIES-64]
MLPTNVPRNSPFVAGSDATAVASCAMAFVADEMSRYCPSSRCCPSFFRSSMCRPIRHLPVSRRQLLAARRHILAGPSSCAAPCGLPALPRRLERSGGGTPSTTPATTPATPPAETPPAENPPAETPPAPAASTSRPSLYPPPLPSRLPFRDYDGGGGGGVEGVAAVSHCSTTLFPASPLPRLLLGVEEGKGEGVRFQGAAELGGAVKRGVVEWVWGLWGSGRGFRHRWLPLNSSPHPSLTSSFILISFPPLKRSLY